MIDIDTFHPLSIWNKYLQFSETQSYSCTCIHRTCHV